MKKVDENKKKTFIQTFYSTIKITQSNLTVLILFITLKVVSSSIFLQSINFWIMLDIWLKYEIYKKINSNKALQ